MPAESILLADEDVNILEVERLYLEREGFRVFSVKAGFDALNSARTIHPNLIILAMELPGLGGFEVCSRLRRDNDQVPIIAVFADESTLLSSSGIGLEADDFLAKPFLPRELVARVRMLLHPQKPKIAQRESTLEFRSLKIDLAKGRFSIHDREIPLRKLDFELMTCLMGEAGRSVTRDRLMDSAWGEPDLHQTAGIVLHMSRLQYLLAGSGVKITADPQGGLRLAAQDLPQEGTA
jgi:DNA-binding response OmpR family regulator